MEQTLTIPIGLYHQLQTTSQQHGLPSIEKLLEYWQQREDALKHKKMLVQQIAYLRGRLQAAYGQFPDSVTLIEEDRAR